MKTKCLHVGCFCNATCRDGMCQAHTTAARSKQGYSTRVRPRTSEPHMGVEVECKARDSAAHRALLAQRIVPCGDGSLGEYGCEYKVCAPGTKIIRKVTKLAEHIKEAGGFVDKSCGLHVHLDVRNVSVTRVADVIRCLDRQRDWLFSLMPPSRRHNGYVTRETNNGHYSWLNHSPQATLEIRLHGGTLNVHKLTGWLSAMKCILDLIHGREFPAWANEPVEMQATAVVAPPPIAPPAAIRPDNVRAVVDTATGRTRRTMPSASDTALLEVLGVRRPRPAAEPSLRVTQGWLEKAYPCPIAREYLLARQNSNGTLDTFETESGEAAEL